MTAKPTDRQSTIRFTVTACPVGPVDFRRNERLLLAVTGAGLRAVFLGVNDAKLEAELRREFSAALLRRDDKGLKTWVSGVVHHVNGRRPACDFPLDVQATPFQCRVWEQLRAIPYGSTRSYRDIACALGRPSAARAVARACAANPLSLVIPCHRVVRADGRLGGYRWGLECKQALLAHEKKVRSKE